MRTWMGIIAVGALTALSGCTSTGGGGGGGGGFTPNARALLASGTTDGEVFGGQRMTTVSDAATDPQTQAQISAVGSPADLETATVTVDVQNGGQLAGPKAYVWNDPGNAPPSSTPYGGFYRFKPEDGTANTILFAGAGNDSFAGVVSANDRAPADATNAATDTAAFFGGTAPTSVPTNALVYYGTAAAVVGRTTSPSSIYTQSIENSGPGTLTADFTNGTVAGDYMLTDAIGRGSSYELTFNGTMATDHATYSAVSTADSTTIHFDGESAYGQVIGGFFGADGLETAGAFDIQNSVDPTAASLKVTGAFGGKATPPP
jgi:hypothetical protein